MIWVCKIGPYSCIPPTWPTFSNVVYGLRLQRTRRQPVFDFKRSAELFACVIAHSPTLAAQKTADAYTMMVGSDLVMLINHQRIVGVAFLKCNLPTRLGQIS